VVDREMPRGAAVVTGGAGVLGAAVAKRLRDAGMTVATIDRAPAGGTTLHVPCDVTDERQVESAVGGIAAELGPIGAVVCAAGIVTHQPLDELTPGEWARVLGASLTGTYLAARAAVRHMPDHAGAAIVGFSSGYGTKGLLHGGHYAAAKAGVEAFMKSLALELGPRGIRANVVAPGPIRSPMTDEIDDAELARRAALIPLGRIGEPEDVADVVRFLVSSDSRYVTGQVLHVNGGLLMP
jgi:NAD(P)-dependent dehydrogenase (short-subunit alcohol dehydrogenase family)